MVGPLCKDPLGTDCEQFPELGFSVSVDELHGCSNNPVTTHRWCIGKVSRVEDPGFVTNVDREDAFRNHERIVRFLVIVEALLALRSIPSKHCHPIFSLFLGRVQPKC